MDTFYVGKNVIFRQWQPKLSSSALARLRTTATNVEIKNISGKWSSFFNHTAGRHLNRENVGRLQFASFRQEELHQHMKGEQQ